MLCLLLICIELMLVQSFSQSSIKCSRLSTSLFVKNQNQEQEYRNPGTRLLGLFIKTEEKIVSPKQVDLNSIQWNKPKRRKSSLLSLSSALEKALKSTEWFVTGLVDPSFFSGDFRFQDPDVKLKGIENYARGVNKIFSQQDSRAEIVSVVPSLTTSNSLTVTWRLSGSINVGPGLKIKPFLVYTDFLVDPSSGLISFQEDRFSIPGYDIVLSSLFPFLVGLNLPWISPPCPDIDVLLSDLSSAKKTKK